MQRDQLADEERHERFGRRPARREEPVLGAYEADRDPLAREPGEAREIVGVSLGVRDDERGAAEGVGVECPQDPRRHGAGLEPPSVGDERVEERDERVEDDGPPRSSAARRGEVEVARVADEDDVELAPVPAQQPRLGDGDPRRRGRSGLPVVALPFPDAGVALEHLHARAAERRDHLRVPRVVAVVRAEVEGPHPAVSSRSRPRAARRAPGRRRPPRAGSSASR